MGIEAAKDNLLDGTEGTGVVTDAAAVVRFEIGGGLRFLSHAETVRVFERACARSGVPVKYTQGFNPHARLSLPLPRAVGVASDDELLILRIYEAQGLPLAEEMGAERLAWGTRIAAQLAEVLPAEIIIGAVTLTKSNASYHPESAQYVLALREGACQGLPDRMADLLAREHLVVERVKPSRPLARSVDVRPFLKSMRLEQRQAIVECGISNAGIIRVDEILTLLDLTLTDLAGPIRRMNITWKIT